MLVGRIIFFYEDLQCLNNLRRKGLYKNIKDKVGCIIGKILEGGQEEWFCWKDS